MSAAVFIVRSTVADPAKRTTFDKWYQNELLPDAVKSFRVKKAWRIWSLTDPAIHQAVYQFDDEAALDRAMKEEVPRLIDKFVRDWPDVPRIRETFVLWSVATASSGGPGPNLPHMSARFGARQCITGVNLVDSSPR